MAPTPALPATDTATAESEAAPFPVVGVGASAGGLEALTAQRDGQAAVVTPVPDSTQSELVAQVKADLASLQSAIKELEVHNEELQAANEEAVSRNEELHHRIRTVTDLSNDLTNLLSSIQIPIVMLGIDLRIRRFTPSATKLFSLLPGDVGRPLADITSRLDVPDLGQLITSVINTLAVVERDVPDAGKQDRRGGSRVDER